MKRKILLLLVLVLLYGAYIGIRLFIFDKETVGRLRIVSTPDAQVFINGTSSGKTPYESSLPPGEYSIKIVPEGKKEAFLPWQGNVQVFENTLSYVSRELAASDLISAGEIFILAPLKSAKDDMGEIVVESEPSGAIVFLDNDQKGITPLKLTGVTPDDHELSLYMPGFFRRSLKIRVEKEKSLQTRVKLALDQSYKTLAQALTEEQKRASAESQLKADTLAATTTIITSSSVTKLRIRETPTGYLNVRSTPGVAGKIITTVKPGEEYPYREDKNGWYKIQIEDQEGWVSGEYIEVIN